MTYEQIVEMVRKVFEYADARNIYEHIAFQVNVVGEGEGIFYFEVADRQCVIEPYDYYDRDGLFITTGKALKDVCERKCTMRSSLSSGKMRFEGDVRKLELCLENIKLSYLDGKDKKAD
ncbi:MAG: SCP-2 sterol transfer family protein [Lachnospiraceae bacterium]|nr:SCP-2 sterol transfer family protein [Lachnospiraceae bacterium]